MWPLDYSMQISGVIDFGVEFVIIKKFYSDGGWSMKRFVLFTLFILLSFSLFSNEIIRISRDDFSRLPLKSVDIAATHPEEGWMDIVVNDEEKSKIEETGISFKVRNLANPTKAVYMTATQIIDSLVALSQNFPTITHIDTLAWSSNGDYPLVCMKISDNPDIDETDEPAALFVGCHHSREWQTPGTVLFFADSILRAYQSGDPDAVKYINDLEIFIYPIMNPEGYQYSMDVYNYWRKTRVYMPQYDEYGVDPNRDYGVSGPPVQSWGTTVNTSTTHDPTQDVFCGPHPFTGTEAASVRDLIIDHPNLYISITYHSYSELVLYPWGSTTDTTVHHTQLVNFSTELASRLVNRRGTGTYSPEQSVGLYPTTGDMTDWAYGYCNYVLGRGHFSLTIEEDTTFQPLETDLDPLYRDQYPGFLYVLAYCDSMIDYPDQYGIYSSVVVEDGMGIVDVGSNTCSLNWNTKPSSFADNFIVRKYVLDTIVETFDTDTNWIFNGFKWDNTHTPLVGTHCAWSDSFAYAYVSMQTRNPVIIDTSFIQNPDGTTDTILPTISFYANYNIETNYDAAYFEISKNGYYWEPIDTTAIFMGNSGGWIKYTYSLPDEYINVPFFMRFRYSTDGGTEYMGFLVDSVSFVCVSDTGVLVASSVVADSTSSESSPLLQRQFASYTDINADSMFIYSISADNRYGSTPVKYYIQTEVSTSMPITKPTHIYPQLKDVIFIANTPIVNKLKLGYTLNSETPVSIYDISGRVVDKFTLPKGYGIYEKEINLSRGVYFLKYNIGDKKKVIKFVK